MDIDHLKCFLSVAGCGSFQESAFQLNMAQSTVSKKIMQLETELGCTLFDRSKKKISLSEKGIKLLPYARLIVSDYQRMIDAAGTSAKQSKLLIGEIYFGSTNPVLGLETAFLKRFPEISLECFGDTTSSLIERIANHSIDVAIVSSISVPLNMGKSFAHDPRFRSISLMKSPYYAVLSTRHPLADKSLVSYKDLARWRFCAPYRSMTVYHDAMKKISEMYGLSYYPQFFSTIRETQRAVEQNLGFTIMTEQALEKSDQIILIPLKEQIFRDTQLIISAQQTSPNSILFFHFAQEYFHCIPKCDSLESQSN